MHPLRSLAVAHQHLRRPLPVFPVAFHYQVTAHDELSLFANGQGSIPITRIDDLGRYVGQQPSDALDPHF